jgi:hypothetical protein
MYVLYWVIRSSHSTGNKTELYFAENGLTITAIDIQYINPVDQTMSDLLMRSVQVWHLFGCIKARKYPACMSYVCM